MEARNRCPKSRIEQHRGIGILEGNWGHPKQRMTKMFMIKKHIFSVGREWDRDQTQKILEEIQ